MSTPDARASFPPGTLLTCGACQRTFVALGADIASDVFCTCGGALEAGPIRSGLYELASSEAFDGAQTARTRAAASRRTAGNDDASRDDAKAGGSATTPHDQGYDKSHGYGPAHGGPTGPGDAPPIK